MININIDESKRLRFKISLSGVHPQDLTGSMKIIKENIEYGFPIKIDNGDVIVDIGPLSKIYGSKIKDGSIFESKLEIIAGDNYLVPWKDEIKINNPIKIEAKVDNIIENIKNISKVEIFNVSEEEINKNIEDKIEEKEIIKKKSKFLEILENPLKKNT